MSNLTRLDDLIYGIRPPKSNIFKKLEQLLSTRKQHRTLQGWTCSQECEKNQDDFICTKKCRKIGSKKRVKKKRGKKKTRKRKRKKKAKKTLGWSFW
jgi:hypothetical protein